MDRVAASVRKIGLLGGRAGVFLVLTHSRILSQNGWDWGWKEPLEISWPNPPANVGWAGFHPGGFGIPPENEAPQTLWVTQCLKMLCRLFSTKVPFAFAEFIPSSNGCWEVANTSQRHHSLYCLICRAWLAWVSPDLCREMLWGPLGSALSFWQS